MLVVQGCSHIECGDETLFLKAPYIVCYPPGVPHAQSNYSSKMYERWCFPVFPTDIGQAIDLPNSFAAVQLTEDQCEIFTSYVQMLYRHWGFYGTIIPWVAINSSPCDRNRLKHLLLLFLNELHPHISSGSSAKSNYINDVCLHIIEHPEERFTLDLLADRFFVGRSTLTKDFRREMGMSVGEFITTVRVNHAKALLQEDLPLGEISEQCGFSSVSYFIKVFIRHTGLSPTRYRAALDELPPE